MGLNLNIRRVIFTSMHKFDGTRTRRLAAPEVKQIAGRAGRFRSAHPEGEVTTLHTDDLPLLHEAMGTAAVPLAMATLMPRPEDLASYVLARPHDRYDDALERFMVHAVTSDHYQLGEMANMLSHATMLQNVAGWLSPEELYTFCASPTDPKDAAASSALLRFVSAYAHDGAVPGQLALSRAPVCLPQTEGELKALEAAHRVCDLYVWLAYRFSGAFRDRGMVEAERAECSEYIALGLDRLSTFIQRGGKPRGGGRGRGAGEDSDDDSEWESKTDEEVNALGRHRAAPASHVQPPSQRRRQRRQQAEAPRRRRGEAAEKVGGRVHASARAGAGGRSGGRAGSSPRRIVRRRVRNSE
ncbi:hypothetical protein FOA52_011521 [Chlamydomonas sp. UWO 241]|nr:hypothetical protein FOA52_011521 [Chlamydomonas sp. UWO 241]